MEHLKKALKELSEFNFTVTTSRGTLALHQTERNNAKKKLLTAILLDLKETLEEEGHAVRDTSYGPVIELLNEDVEEEVFRKEYRAWLKEGNKGNMQQFLKAERALPSGMISIQTDFIIKNLDTNAQIDEASNLHDREQKRIREEEKKRAKERKIKRDAEVRAEKKRRREETLAKLERANSRQ